MEVRAAAAAGWGGGADATRVGQGGAGVVGGAARGAEVGGVGADGAPASKVCVGCRGGYVTVT